MTTLDARGLACPMPVLLAHRRMAELAPGQILRVLTTDPEAPIDLAAWATDEGHAFRDLTDRAQGTGWLTLELRKAA